MSTDISIMSVLHLPTFVRTFMERQSGKYPEQGQEPLPTRTPTRWVKPAAVAPVLISLLLYLLLILHSYRVDSMKLKGKKLSNFSLNDYQVMDSDHQSLINLSNNNSTTAASRIISIPSHNKVATVRSVSSWLQFNSALQFIFKLLLTTFNLRPYEKKNYYGETSR